MRSFFISAALIIAVYAALAMLDQPNFPYDDGAEHGAVVREMAKNLVSPGEPMLSTYEGKSPRYVPSVLIMALCVRLFNLDIIFALKLFSIIFFILFIAALALFVREYFEDSRQMVWSVFCILFLWGIGWTGANAYMFSAIIATAYYPSLVSFSLALLALYLQLRFIATGKKVFLFYTCAACAFSFVNHPLTGMFFLVCSGLLYIEKRAYIKKPLLYFGLSLVSLALLMTLWPYYDFLSNFTRIASGEMGDIADDYKITREYLYSRPLLRIGPALAGIPLIILFMKKKKYFFVVWGFVICSSLYALGFFLNISLAERFVFFAVFFMQISFSIACRTWYAGSMKSVRLGQRRNLAVLGCAVLMCSMIFQARITFVDVLRPCFTADASFPFVRYISPNALQRNLKKYFKEGDVVLSDMYSSWSIPVYTGAKIIALYHTPPHISDNIKRISDVMEFYNPLLEEYRRKEIIKKYRVDKIFLNFKIDGEKLVPILKQQGFHVIAVDESFCVFSTLL